VTSWLAALSDPDARIDPLAESILCDAMERARNRTLALAVLDRNPTPVDGFRLTRGPKLFLPLIGANSVEYPGGALRIPSDSLGLLPSRFPHRETRQPFRQRYAHLFIQLTADALNYNVLYLERDQRRMLGPALRPNQRPDLLLGLASDLSDRARRGELQEAVTEGLVLYFLGLLLEQFTSDRRTTASALVMRARTIIDAELTDRDLTVGRIASELRVHPDYLSRQFHAETGERLKTFIQHQRLQLARELFLGGSLNVSEVATITGFNDHAYFTRVFREFAGMTPTQYRQETARIG